MSDLVHRAHASAQAGASPAIGRRHVLGGLALTAAALAGGEQILPQWGAGAPARVGAPTLSSPLPLPLPTPRAVQYGAADRAEWQAFRHRFVTPEGRVIDTGNGNVSHSEGQGWGMLAAQACDDPETFARLAEWTSRNLQTRPYDCLHSWRYRPGAANPVADPNNATDGDLFIAAALARAAVRWDRPDYAAGATRLAKAILGLVRQAGARTVLLPGATGFEAADAFTINPSYYAFALFPDLAALAPSPAWAQLQQDGLAMILQGRFGHWGLPPDWLRVSRRDGALSIAPGWPPRFSYDAIRVPLHLAWARLPATPVLESFGRYWGARRGLPPGWVDLNSGEMATYGAPPGLQAVAAVAMAPGAERTIALPSVMMANDYYSAGLVLLSRLALVEGRATT